MELKAVFIRFPVPLAKQNKKNSRDRSGKRDSTRTEKQRIRPSLPPLLPRCIIWKKFASQDQPDSSGRSSSACIASDTTSTFPHMRVSQYNSIPQSPTLAKLESTSRLQNLICQDVGTEILLSKAAWFESWGAPVLGLQLCAAHLPKPSHEESSYAH